MGGNENHKFYKIRENDLVTVSVHGHPDLLTTQRIDQDGLIQIPLVGVIKIGGISVRDAEKHIVEAFVNGKFLRSPQVIVSIIEFMAREISVMGEVKKPGPVVLDPDKDRMLITVAIAKAGGLTDIAKSNAVRVVRQNSEGEEFLIEVDLDQFIKPGDFKKGRKKQFILIAGDVVVVPRRLF
tara:strand:- start:3015 stop:3560 length:546 start_codon:yes stop_codon:yes gene_type:complete